MSLNTLAWRRVKQVNAKTGERFVHGSLASHGDWWIWRLVRHDGSSVDYNTRTGEMTTAEPCTSTERLLRERTIFPHHDESDWLAELDSRAAELRRR